MGKPNEIEIAKGLEEGLEINIIVDYTTIRKMFEFIEDHPNTLSPNYNYEEGDRKQFLVKARKPQKNSYKWTFSVIDWKSPIMK